VRQPLFDGRLDLDDLVAKSGERHATPWVTPYFCYRNGFTELSRMTFQCFRKWDSITHA